MTPMLNLLPDSTPLANQVAGHQNVLSDASGSLVIKPALPREIAFYQLINSSPRSSPLARLKAFVPQFYGTLRLEGQMQPGGRIDPYLVKDVEVPESVVLENLAHAFTRPSILDVKLGTVMCAPDASREKMARMEAKAREGTSLDTGMRLTGSQTWHAPSQSYILTPKSYGKSLVPSQLPQGMIRFFPLPSDIIPSLIVPLTTPPSTASNSSPSSAPPTHLLLPSSMPALTVPLTPVSASTNMAYTQHDLQAHLLLRVLDILDHEISRLISTVASLEMRFIGSSVLVVYEGDESRLASALERYDIWSQLDSRFMVAASYPDDEDDDDEDEELNSLESSTSSEDDEDDGTRADARLARRCPPLSLRMIDFAHTRLVEGEGPDEGVLKGLRTLESLVRNRKVGVRAYLAGQESEDGVPSLYEPSTRPGDGQGRQTMLA